MVALGFERLSLAAAHNLKWDSNSRRAKNCELLQRLKIHAEIIKYANLNEPKDGTLREAYCVLSPDQVVRIMKEAFKKE